MQTPARRDMEKLKRAARFVLGKPRPVQEFPMQGRKGVATVFSDSDFAGCRRTRKSTSFTAPPSFAPALPASPSGPCAEPWKTRI